jgi:arabinose-5-phosphate isomerase
VDTGVAEEACPLNLAPTASTTAQLAMGDALASALLAARGFTPEDFARSHPGGALGRRLLLRVADVMRQGEALPRVGVEATLEAGLVEMSRKGLGLTAVTDAADRLLGVFTDGDLRRALDGGAQLRATTMEQVMTRAPRTIAATALAAEAINRMQEHCITALLVVDGEGRLRGALNIHDLLRAGVV